MSIVVKRINRQVQVVRVGKQGKTGETGPQGPKGDQGDPATNLVQSVNGKQGVVVLNSSDVNADPTGSASQALQDAKDYTDSEVGVVATDLSDHEADKSNPHEVTKVQVGLSDVDNTSDANKPISTATQAALDGKAETSYVDYRDRIESGFLSQAIIKPITIFDPGHGFTKTSSAGTQTEDSIDGYKKNNSMVLTTAGDGSPVTSRKSVTTIDFTGKIPIIAIKVSAIANLSKILVKLSSDGMTSNWYSLNPDPEKFRFLNDNVWIPVNLSFSVATIPRNGAVDYSPLVGSPDRSSINTIEVSVQDNSLGPVSVKFGLIGYTDEPPRPAVSLTFDDGRISQYTLARKKMDEYGMPGTAYINDYSVGDGTHMSIAQLKEMQDQSGWDISAHTSSHINLVNATASEVERQFRVNKTWLIENGFSKGANHLAYPFGRFDYEKVIPLAKKYFASARTVASYPESSKTSNPYALRGYYVLNTSSLQQMKDAVTRAIANNEWALFTFHSVVVTPTGVSEDLPQATFDAFIDWLATQDVDVKPVSQVLEAQAPSTDSSKLNKSGDIMDGNLGFSTPSGTPPLPITIGYNSSGIGLYNTLDQVTDYARLRIYSTSAMNYLMSEKAGTGEYRPIHIGSNAGSGLQVFPLIDSSSTGGFIRTIGSFGSAGAVAVNLGNGFNAAYSTTQTQLAIRPLINQGSSAAYTALLINPTETTTGTGAKLLIDAQVNGTSKFKVANDGRVNINGADHITGSGFPNGVVTAPVGSIYIDTAVTNGASSWIKTSGTGNTGWSIDRGETATKTITPENGDTGIVSFYRAGNVVTVNASVTIGATRTNPVATLPSGYTPRRQTRASYEQTGVPALKLGQIASNGDLGFFTSPTVGSAVTFDRTYITSDPWPTT